MGWPVVILYAVGTAILTSLFLIVPVFKDTSFERMGATLEAWVFFAVIVMANCKKPLESALKTFVFFLVSQPLIYLFQVPFSWQGWGLFSYYKYWFILTLATFPAALAGWFITKKNWLSVLIFAPVFALLGYTVAESGSQCIRNFPHLLVTCLFCVLQIVLYIYVFFPGILQKLVGLLVPVIVVVVMTFTLPQVDLQATEQLPGEAVFSEEGSTVEVEDDSICGVQLVSPEEGTVYLYAHKYGVTGFRIKDGDQEKQYSLEVYNDQGVDRIQITEK